jgi:hypothetical protein
VFAFNEDQMGVPTFGPAPHINVDEFARRLRAPSRPPCLSESSSRLSQCARNTGKESIEPLVRSSPQLRLDPGDGTSIVDTDDPRAVDDLRRWWQQRLPLEVAQDHSRGRKLTGMAIAVAGIALISSALALKGGTPTMLNRPPVAPPVSNIARAQNPSGQTEGTPADIGIMPPAGLSGATPVVRGVDAQSVEGVALKTSAQKTDPEAAPRAAEGTKMALQISAVVADAPRPPSRPPAERRNSVVETMQPSIDLPVKRPSKITARVVVGKTEAEIRSAAADTLTPPLPLGIPTKPEREASGAHAMQPITDSAAAPATDNEAAKRSPNPFLRALGNLFGAQGSPSRQSIDTAAVGSTGWTVQLGAPRSEAEAKRDLKRVNTKYGSALRGSTVGLRKVLVNGETVYRLHVVGLSRNGAASLCSRVKGDGGSCSIVR